MSIRVLTAAPYLFIPNHKHGSRNRSGLAYMIREIVDMLSDEMDVDVITQSILSNGEKISNWNLLPKNLWLLLKSIKWPYIKLWFLLCKNGKCNVNETIKILFYCITGSYTESLIKKQGYNIMHIHSIGFYTIPFFHAAARTSIKTCITLHGLYSVDIHTSAGIYLDEMERRFIINASAQNHPISFISSGMISKSERVFGCKCENTKVICNCFNPVFADFKHANQTERVSEFRIICIGSMTTNKNHIQVVRNLKKIEKLTGKHILLSILGDGDQMEFIRQYIKVNSLTDCVQLKGRVKKEVVIQNLAESDLLILPSINEGFGIPVVEAYSLGVPVVYFSDIDAAEDLYNGDCAMMIPSRDDETFCRIVAIAIEKRWNMEKIKRFSRKFSRQTIQKQYVDFVIDAFHKDITYNDIEIRHLIDKR